MKRTLTTIICSFILACAGIAQEGMWLLNQIDQLNLKEAGLKIPTTAIFNPGQPAIANAVVQLGGGTASFVSPEGLLLTNHHVAYTALQRASNVQSNYLTDGFLAREKSEEIQAPGYRARILVEMKDVTGEILEAAKGIDDLEVRDRKIQEKSDEISKAIEDQQSDADAGVVSMYNGKQYILFIYKVLKDIRIVYSPPLSIGNYGGEIDNWMWPRHTGDFSFLRAYVAPDGKGAAYSEQNIPYKPEIWLKVARENLNPGDFTFVVGFPGSTTRYRTSNSAAWNLTENYPFSIENYGAIIALAEELTKNDPEGQLKVASLTRGLANAMKNYQGKVDGMIRTKYVDRKKKFEEEFMVWVNSTPETKAKYGTILDQIQAQYKVIKKTKDRDNILGLFQGLAGTRINVAYYAWLIATEKEKPEQERIPGFSQQLIDNLTDGLQYTYNNYYEPFDKALLVRTLKMVQKLPGDQRMESLDYIFNGSYKSVEEFVDEAYKNSRLDELDYVKSLLDKSTGELKSLNDPIITLMAEIYPYIEENRVMNNTFGTIVIDLRKQYIDALYEWKGSALYPDANGTIRFTYGPVKGYSPEDAVWYEPFTTLRGVVEKNTGIRPFDAPEKLITLYETKDYGQWTDPELKDVPVAFLHRCDITGGNSGSPVMNASGEVIGVVFDGNYEAMISDWQYDYEIQRTISVDIRYVLFITQKFAGADFILKEMGVN
ncbi:MAG: S46 family peptidase [Bacteroidetes bacterium]|nr:MAG: S46 family peptidase [Bacteroidota bacterium]